MRPLFLKAATTALTLGATVASALFVTSHLKNSSAPLQPPVLNAGGSATVDAAGGTLTVGPSVQPSNQQPVTSTYAS
jgi:hypothetical protein